MPSSWLASYAANAIAHGGSTSHTHKHRADGNMDAQAFVIHIQVKAAALDRDLRGEKSSDSGLLLL